MISLCSYPMCLMRRSFDGFDTPRLMLFNRLLFGVLIVFAGNRVCGVGNLRWITALSIWQLDRNLLESSRFARESFSSLCDIFLSFSRLICVVVVRILAQMFHVGMLAHVLLWKSQVVRYDCFSSVPVTDRQMPAL
jgi:hypothetical protein